MDKHLGPPRGESGSWRLMATPAHPRPVRNEVPTRQGLRLRGLSLPRPLPSWTSARGRSLRSPPPARVGLLPTAVTLLRVVRVLLADRIQHGQQLGLRGCGQGHAQEPVQHARRHHRQPGQVRGQSQLLEELGHDAA